MSTLRRTRTVVVTVVDGEDHPVGQLRIAGPTHEQTWAINLGDRDNLIGTVREAIAVELGRMLEDLEDDEDDEDDEDEDED